MSGEGVGKRGSTLAGVLLMLTLPPAMVGALAPCAPLFSARVWRHVQVLLAGALLAPAQRTVTAALRVTGRAHLGVETQRQWSELAIRRTTPALCGLFSLVTVLVQQRCADLSLPVRRAAWYRK